MNGGDELPLHDLKKWSAVVLLNRVALAQKEVTITKTNYDYFMKFVMGLSVFHWVDVINK